MKAAIQHKNGDPTSPDVLSVEEDVAVPEPAAGQVLVKVSCASVNPIDYKLVAGDFPGKKAGPFGCDVSGTKPLVDAREFSLTTAGVGDIVKASMTHRTKGKLVLTVSKQ